MTTSLAKPWVATNGRVPLWLKAGYTSFLCVLVPYYWHAYGPANFLWFCDVALLFTLVALWTERPILASIPAVGIVLPQLMWCADFLVRLITGGHLIDMTEYMFNPEVPLFVRGLSLFHGWLPLLLLWLVYRLGYDRRAVLWQTLTCWGVLIASFLLLSDPNGTAGNVNKIFGLNDTQPQTWMPAILWLSLLMVAYPLLIYIPTHAVLRRGMPQAQSAPQAVGSIIPLNSGLTADAADANG